MNRATSADQRTDIYSLGVIIIELFTRHADRRYLHDIPSEKFRQIADKCTVLNPNDRFQSCDEILRLLLGNGTSSNPMPPWLEAKIKDYASDGVITRNERAVLDKEIAKAGVDRDLAEAIISDEIDKAIARKRKEELDRRNRMANAATKLNDEGGKGGRKFFWILFWLILLACMFIGLFWLPARAQKKQAQQQQQISSLNEEKESLTDKVAIASQLDATSIRVSALNKRGKDAKKIADVKKFQISFSIARNVTAATGNRSIYVRILKPTNEVLTGGGTRLKNIKEFT